MIFAETYMNDTTPETALRYLRGGLFPMGYAYMVLWHANPERYVLDLENLNVPRNVRREILKDTFTVTVNRDFHSVLHHCATTGQRDAPAKNWINLPLRKLFHELHAQGYAHSVECWKGGRLAGGLFGMAIGGVFFGESRFSLQNNASKVALVHLAARLWHGGFTILDSQTENEHLQEQFGQYPVRKSDFDVALSHAVDLKADFHRATQTGERKVVGEYLEFLRARKMAVHNAPKF